MTSVRATAPFVKAPGDERNWAFIFEDAIELPAGTTIASVEGTPEVTCNEESPVTLVLSDVSVAATAFTDDDGLTVPANKAVKADVSGGAENRSYEVSIIVNLSTGEKVQGIFSVLVKK